MALSLDHKDSAHFSGKDAKRKCFWPLYHADKHSFKDKGTVRDLPIHNKHGVRAGGLQVTTRRQTEERLVKAGENTEKKCEEKLLSVF